MSGDDFQKRKPTRFPDRFSDIYKRGSDKITLSGGIKNERESSLNS